MFPVPELNGLVLAGGRSTRMGHDKGLINWHGKPQREYMADLLKSYCREVFISCREDQQLAITDGGYTALTDNYTDLGPFGALLSAFELQENKAWLVVACDLPLLDKAHLDQLCAERNPVLMATAFEGTDGVAEPLMTIWEPSAYPALLSCLATGYSSARSVLLKNEITVLKSTDQQALANVNSRDEADKIIKSFL